MITFTIVWSAVRYIEKRLDTIHDDVIDTYNELVSDPDEDDNRGFIP